MNPNSNQDALKNTDLVYQACQFLTIANSLQTSNHLNGVGTTFAYRELLGHTILNMHDHNCYLSCAGLMILHKTKSPMASCVSGVMCFFVYSIVSVLFLGTAVRME